VHVVCADCASTDSNDFVEISASDVNRDDELETNITSHLTLATRALDDVSARMTALKPPDDMMPCSARTSATCDAYVTTVSTYGQFVP